MCKHILINNFNPSDVSLIKDFTLRTNENDGYGAIIRYKSNEIDTIKSLNQGEFYIRIMEQLDAIQTIVIHHRTSTNGKGLDYAHPFQFKGYYLTHNGVVSVPGKHKTKTTNDSEQLLHHLIKTDFETKSISGYYSCFLLTKTENIILVDKTAPLYTDDRVYCSHDLGPEFSKIEASLIVIDPWSGKLIKNDTIEVGDSFYGREYSYLSLSDKSWHYEACDEPSAIDVFFDELSADEEDLILNTRDYSEAMDYVLMIAENMLIELTEEEMSTILGLLDIAA